MFNIGFTEFLVIGVVALIFIGPKQLPEVARVVGRLLGELRKATQDLSGGLLEVTQDVRSTIDQTKEDIMNEGRKAMDSVVEPLTDMKDDFSNDMGYGHHDEEDLELEGESHDNKEEEPKDGKS